MPTKSSLSHPYDDLLDEVQRPSRYVGGEYRTRPAPPRTPDALHVILGFPDVYEVGMSHLGLQILHARLDALPWVRPDRAFAPWPDMEQSLRQRGRPLLSLDEQRPLREADVLGLSLQHELTFTNVLTMLDLGGIPLHARDRRPDDPIVLGGGPLATHPEPVAPFFDAFLVGDGETALPSLLGDLRDLKRDGVPRTEALSLLAAGHPYLYVPALYRTERVAGRDIVTEPADSRAPWPIRRAAADLGAEDFPVPTFVPTAEAVFDRASVEIARGCQHGCRFCQAGMIYRPTRERPAADVARTLLESARACGYDEVSLTSLSTADYTALPALVPALMERLDARRVALSVSSLRAYGLPDELLDAIGRVRRTGLTLAPEAGTQRLRDVINKNISEDDLLAAVASAAQRGWRRVKLYFMVGLPTETEEDALAIPALAARVRAAGRKPGARPVDVSVAVSNHVPRPHCPFQWEGMLPPAELNARHEVIRDAARGSRLRLRFHDVEMSWLEAVLARGDRRLADVILHAWRHGARFDSWDERFAPTLWHDALGAEGVDTNPFVAADMEPGRLPWDHIHVGLDRTFLLKERERALAAEPTPACGELGAALSADGRWRCHACGADCRPSESPEHGTEGEALRRAIAGFPAPPRAATSEEELVRLRLEFSKRGTARTLSHLELVRHVARTLRRAGLRLAYSEGFHPHPRIVLAPALSTGVEAWHEPMDAVVAADSIGEDLLESLNACSPRGLGWLGLDVLPKDAPKVSRTLRLVDFLVGLDANLAAAALGVAPDDAGAAFARRADRWRESPEAAAIVVERQAESRTLDASAALAAVDSETIVAAYSADLPQAPSVMWFGYRTNIQVPGAALRPAEWLSAVLPDYSGFIRAVRAGFPPSE